MLRPLREGTRAHTMPRRYRFDTTAPGVGHPLPSGGPGGTQTMHIETSEIEYPIFNKEYPTDQVWEHSPWILDIPWLLDIKVTTQGVTDSECFGRGQRPNRLLGKHKMQNLPLAVSDEDVQHTSMDQ